MNDRLFLKPYDYHHNAIETRLNMFKSWGHSIGWIRSPLTRGQVIARVGSPPATTSTTLICPQWHLQALNVNFFCWSQFFCKNKLNHKNISILQKAINIFYSVNAVKRNLLTTCTNCSCVTSHYLTKYSSHPFAANYLLLTHGFQLVQLESLLFLNNRVW